jgi:hypothetical protein
LRQHQALFTPPGRDHVERRLAAGLVEKAAQYLALLASCGRQGAYADATQPSLRGQHVGRSVTEATTDRAYAVFAPKAS